MAVPEMSLGPAVRRAVNLPMYLSDGSLATAKLVSFVRLSDEAEHVALVFGEPAENSLVRVHSECLTGDTLGSARCDCGGQLADAISTLADFGGVLLYLRQEGRGIGLYNKIDAYSLQEAGLDTFAANRQLHFPDDARDYSVGAQMLRALGIASIVLLSNNPDKARQLAASGIEVERTIPTRVHLNPHNVKYLEAKSASGHSLQVNEPHQPLLPVR